MILEYEKDNLWKIGDVGDMKWDDTTPTTIELLIIIIIILSAQAAWMLN